MNTKHLAELADRLQNSHGGSTCQAVDAIRSLIAANEALTADRDEWKEATIAANENQRTADNIAFKLREERVNLQLANEALAKELESVRADAERYRWLRKAHHDDATAIGVTRERMNGWGRISAKSLRNKELDTAIDAARSATP